MKNTAQQTLRNAFAILALAGLGLAIATGTAWYESLDRMAACMLVLLPLAAVFIGIIRSVQREDSVTRLEAALCRERNARSEADHALAEADLLLARLAARARMHGADPASQMTAIGAELTQLQRQLANEQPQLARRLEHLCRRLERATASLRTFPRAAEPG
jgi:hypothetical protein